MLLRLINCHIIIIIIIITLFEKIQKCATKLVISVKQQVKVIWQKVPHGGPIPRLGVTPGGRNLYDWIPGVGVPIRVP